MSDEESFVILGTSPGSSLDTINSLPAAGITTNKIKTEELNKPVKIIGVADSQLTISSSSNASQSSVFHNGQGVKVSNGVNENVDVLIADNINSFEPNISEEPLPRLDQDAGSSSSNSYKQLSANHSLNSNGSLAASFILGEVDSDVLKSSVYSQFPSISMGACAEDVVKLQNMMSEYMELKKTLINTNTTMKQWYIQTEKWKTDSKAMENESRAEIAKLRNENLELRRDLENKVAHITINEEARQREHEDFVRNLSEKSAQIKNMSAQIQKLEQVQLASFEVVPKIGTETTTEPNGETEYVTAHEHHRVVKSLERQMSEILAENLQLKDMHQQYIDEINCLKVNLVAAEELQRKAEVDINFLKASDIEKSEMFTKYGNENKTLRVEIDVLRQQLDIYSRDYKIEQDARENLANEKEQLLFDLRMLQRKNHELIQEAQKNYEENARQIMGATGAFPKTRTQPAPSPSPMTGTPIYTPTDYKCPLCDKNFKTLSVLQNHVNHCLDGN